MPFADNQNTFGQITATGNPIDLNLGFVPTYFRLWNQTAFNSVANPGVTKIAWFNQGMAADSAFTIENTDGAATDECELLTSGGFTLRDGVEEQLGAALSAGGAIARGGPSSVTITSHGLITGDTVRLYGTTGMLQVAGFDYVITRTGANTFTIPVDSTGFAADATAATIRRVIIPRAFEPRVRTITAITQASSAVITTATNHNYVVGEFVRIQVPAGWGMVEANGLLVQITAVTANTLTVNLDTSSGFSTFAYPTSAAAAAGIGRPEIVPVGEIATTLSASLQDKAFAGIRIGSQVCGATSDIIFWEAVRSAIFQVQ